MTKVLFVCLGNICRSPAGQAILERDAKKRGLKGFHVESCALGDWHIGSLPNPRMRKAAAKRGLELTSIAQELKPSDFSEFDYILAADQAVLEEVKKRAKGGAVKGEISLITHASYTYRDEDIPDPYHLDAQAFENALDMLEEACDAFLDTL